MKRALPFLLFGVLVLLVWANPLFFRRNFAGRDLLAYNLPVEKAIHDAYSRGRLPIWLEGVSGGRPLLPNPNMGALYPLRPVLALVPFPLAMRIFPVFHWLAAGLGMMLLLRTLGTSRGAAWIGAVTYVFSGPVVGEVFFPQQPGLALLPWILWAFVRPAGGRTARVLLLAALFFMDITAGDVFTLGLALLGCALWTWMEVPPGERRRTVSALAAGVFLAALLALPQILATALWIPETNRAVVGIRLVEAFFFSIHPVRLLELVIPYPFGATWEIDPSRVWAPAAFGGKATGIFPTLYAGAFAVLAVAVTWRARGVGLRFARLFLAVMLVCSVLPSLTPRGWGNLLSPIALRNPEKLAIGLVFALAVLAAHAFDLVRAGRPAVRGAIAIACLLAAASLTMLAAAPALSRIPGRGGSTVQWKDAARQAPASLAEAGLLWLITAVALDRLRQRGPGSVFGPLLLLTAVPLAANRRIAPTFREDQLFPPTAFARHLARADPTGAYRTLAESFFMPSALQSAQHSSDVAYIEFSRRNWEQYTHVLWNRGTVLNYDFDSGDLSRVESLRRLSLMAARHADADEFFAALSLRWGVRYRDQPSLPGYRRFGGDALQHWDEHPDALPDIRLAGRWRESPGAVAALSVLPTLAADEIVLETGRSGTYAAAPGRVETLEKTPERLRLRTETSQSTWLFVLRGFWRHRSVAVDGELVEPVAAMLAFTAVPVPPGTHVIEWRERLPGWDVSRWGPVAFLACAAFLYFRGRGARVSSSGSEAAR